MEVRAGSRTTGADAPAIAPLQTRTARRTRPARRALLAGGLGIGLLGALAACGDDEEQAREEWSAMGERPEKHANEPRVLGEPLTPEDPRGLECSSARLTLTNVARRSVLEPEDARIISGKGEGPSRSLNAPEDEEFLLFTLGSESFVWDLDQRPEPPAASIAVRRHDGTVVTVMDPVQLPGNYTVRVAADPDPQDAVLEVSEGGRTQRLSLIDGSLIDTEVPHVYGRTRLSGSAWPGGGIEVVGEQAPDASGQEARDADGGIDRVTLVALSARDMPMSRSLGWAEDGEQLLRLEIDAFHHFSRREIGSVLLPVDLAASVLRLPDGTEREPLAIADSLRPPDGPALGSTVHLWFSIPVDLEAAEARITAVPFPRRKGLAEQLAASCSMTIPLTLEQQR